jgi:hypothetical protein
VNPHFLPDRGQIPHFLPEGGQFPHVLPEGGNENSPGWSPPQRTQSWETAPNKSFRPVGEERSAIASSSDVHAIGLNQTPTLPSCPVFPAWMNYDFKVEEFSSRLTRRRTNALTSHRPLCSTRNPNEGGIYDNALLKDEGQDPGIQPALSQPAKSSQKTGRDGCAPGSNRSGSLARQS